MTLPQSLESLAAHRKTAWKPIAHVANDAAEAGSAPNLKPLKCPQCEGAMDLFLHLHSAHLPADLPPDFPRHQGILEVWYCTECADWEPFSKSHVLRLLPDDENNGNNAKPSLIGHQIITGWEVVEDYPNLEEAADLGCELSEAAEEEFYELENPSYPHDGDKLGGWPDWVQGVEYPQCPECGETMELFFQLDSEDHLDYMFGDSGCAHVTRCKNHPHQFALGWACY